MSQSCDETYDVYQEVERKARKEHRCSACQEVIPKGRRYFAISMVFDGSAESLKRCFRCQSLHLHLRDNCESFDRLWPDERLNCGQSYEAEWGELPADIAALAFRLPSEDSEHEPTP